MNHKLGSNLLCSEIKNKVSSPLHLHFFWALRRSNGNVVETDEDDDECRDDADPG